MAQNDRGLTIDGSQGEGGGQILRSSLALSLVTGRPFVIEKIRAGRKRPGLMRQHLASVKAAAEVGQAEVEGAYVGSLRLTFRPGRVKPGRYTFRVGTAGSATLVLQTVLPALLVAEGESDLTLEGGTHNAWAPPFDFLADCYLPLVNRLGPKVEAQLVRPGFYPAGGGEFTVRVCPASTLGHLELLERGEIVSTRVRALVSHLPGHIAQRECDTIALQTGWDKACFSIEEVAEARGPGNAVMIALQSRDLTEVFTGFGRLGVRAEAVAEEVLSEANPYLNADVPVGKCLADQLMLPLALGAHLGSGGGQFRTLALTPHSTTHLAVIHEFLNVAACVETQTPDTCLVRLDPNVPRDRSLPGDAFTVTNPPPLGG